MNKNSNKNKINNCINCLLRHFFSTFEQSFSFFCTLLKFSFASSALEKFGDRIDGVELRIDELKHLAECRTQIGQAHEKNRYTHGRITHAHDSALPGEWCNEAVAHGRYGRDREQDGREKRPFRV